MTKTERDELTRLLVAKGGTIKIPGGAIPHGQAAKANHRQSKYRAKPTIVDGIRYASKGEAFHAINLNHRLASGEIRWWIRQVPIRLSPPGDEMVDITRVDFLVGLASGSVVAEEYKGASTRQWERVKKAWAKYGPFPLLIYRKGKKTELIRGGGQRHSR